MADPKTPWLRNYPGDVPHSIDAKLYENLSVFIDDVCSRYAKRRAFVSFGSSITFEDFKHRVDCLAAYFQQKLGVIQGDKLGVILPNLIQYPIAVFAGIKCGMQIVNINPLYTSHEMLGILRDAKIKIVVAFEKCNQSLLKVLDQTYLQHYISCSAGDCMPYFKGMVINFTARYIKRLVPSYDGSSLLYFNDCLREGEKYLYAFKAVDMKFDDIAFLQYTGGTTGKPKGAMLSHGNIIANVVQADAMYGPRLKKGDETILTALPLYHIFAMTVNLMFAMYVGCTNILIVDPRQFPTLIATLRKNPDISIITGVNTLFNAFVHYEVFKKVSLPHLRIVIGGGTAVQHGVADQFLKASGIPIHEGYGLTECSPLCCVVPYTQTEFTGTIGVPTPSTLARIVDTSTGEEIWDPNRPGELEFKGPQVMKGYFDNELETRNVFDDDWLRTGDIAEWSDNYHIRIIDRIKDMIIVSGFNVFPSEIENVLSHNPKILECAVVGMPSKSTGESIKLYVVRRDWTLTKEEVLDYCRQYLTGYKVPKHIEFVETLPKSAVGKVMRRYLKQNRLK